MEYACWWSGSSPSEKDERKTILRCLFNAGGSNRFASEIYTLIGFRGGKDVFQYLQQHTYTPYYELPLEDRFEVAYTVEFWWSNAAELTRIALVQDRFDQETVVYTNVAGLTSLHIVTRGFAQNCCRFRAGEPFYDDYNNTLAYEDIHDPNNPWRVLVRDVITAGALLHAINSRLRSILGYIISAICNSRYFREQTNALSPSPKSSKSG